MCTCVCLPVLCVICECMCMHIRCGHVCVHEVLLHVHVVYAYTSVLDVQYMNKCGVGGVCRASAHVVVVHVCACLSF